MPFPQRQEKHENSQTNTVMDIDRDRTLFWDSEYLCHFSTEMAEIWSPGTSFQDVWTHANFQLPISCTFIVMKVFVVYLVISTKSFITFKVQEIES